MIMRKLSLNIKHIPSFLLAIIATITLSAIYHADSTLCGAQVYNILVYAIYILLAITVLFLLFTAKRQKLRVSSILALVSIAAFFAMENIFSKYGSAGVGVLPILLCIVFCLSPKDVQREAFIIFRKIWILICIIGIFCFMCYTLKIPIPYERVSYYFGENMHYVNYGVSFLYDNNSFLRLCGICNEPGLFGTFCALVLCVDGLKIKKKGNFVILIAGSLTFSVAFVMIIAMYLVIKFLIKAHKEKNTRQKVLRYGIVLLAVFSYVVILPNVKTGINSVDTMLQRVTLTSEGISGDNRTSKEFDALYNSTPFTELVFGRGRGYLKANSITNVSSYKMYLLEYGIVGSLIIWGTLLAAALYKNTKNVKILIFVAAFFASIYQRPGIISLPYLLLLFGGIEYIKYYNSSKQLEEKNESN